tara:strand:+ start:385 stop:1167 length:783 start_codon:yes stop_codon:yes gene_type:complete
MSISFFLKKSNFQLTNPECILLDKDGTLIDVHHYWTEMTILRVKNVLKEFNISDKAPDQISRSIERTLGIDHANSRIFNNGPAGVLPRKEINKILKKALLKFDLQISERKIAEIFDKVDLISEKNIKFFLKVLPGVEEFLNRCKEFDIRLALISNDITSRLRLCVDSLGYLENFTYLIGQDKYNLPKPDKKMALSVLESGNFNKNKVISIGDHPNDIRMCLNAGIKNNIAVLSGLSSKEDFQGLDCLITDTFEEIIINEL